MGFTLDPLLAWIAVACVATLFAHAALAKFADAALFGAIKQHLRRDIPIVELETTVNDPVFAAACARELLAGGEPARVGVHRQRRAHQRPTRAQPQVRRHLAGKGRVHAQGG